MFMQDVVGGSPIFAFRGAQGGFRVRYGRSRNTGLASVGVNPATMEILGGFVAVGVQMRTERPGKAGIVTAVDSVAPTVVRMMDGSVVRIDNPSEARAVKDRIDRILFLGDLIVGYGEFLENNRPLIPSGFVEEWWGQLLAEKLKTFEAASMIPPLSIPQERLHGLAANPLSTQISAKDALEISGRLGIPLHPLYTFFWDAIKPNELQYLRERILEFSEPSEETILLPNDTMLKSLLERLCLHHRVQTDSIRIREDETLILRKILKPENRQLVPEGSSTLEHLSLLAGFPVKSKAPNYVGARMGRPEKAKERVMTPKVHCLFPTVQFGGMRRDIVEASHKLAVSLDVVDRVCPSCDAWEPRIRCPACGSLTVEHRSCPRCGLPGLEFCKNCNVETVSYKNKPVDLKKILEAAVSRVGLAKSPEIIKGTKGLLNKTKTPEPLEKGLLRAGREVSVFKDGTIRFDATNSILTQFRPIEVGLSTEKAHLLGYEKDMEGKPLESPNQLCSLEVQDLVVPESCAKYLLKASKFLDDLLSSYYGLERFYNASKSENLIGRLVVGLSPHTSVGVVGRIVGFTKASVCYAHPFWHAAKRRDCDGDEDSVSLLLDVLLNFSREFMPDRIGGLMDAPLLLSPLLNPAEIARQALNIENVSQLPVEFYDKTWQGAHPSEVESLVATLNSNLWNGGGPWTLGFTQPSEALDNRKLNSSYKENPPKPDQVQEQHPLADQIVAVKGEEVAVKVLSTHILRDLVGNLRTFTTQRVRCTKCGSKPRRVPLGGTCHRCGGKLAATVFRGGVEKYLDVATEMGERYNNREYYRPQLQLIKVELAETFKALPVDREQQKLFVADFA